MKTQASSLFLALFLITVSAQSIALGADLPESDNSNLRAAIERDDVRTVRKMIEGGIAKPDTRVLAPGYGGPGAPILALAAREGSVRVAEYLIRAKANLELKTPMKETPLMLAAFYPDASSGDEGPGDNPSYEKHEKIVHLLVEAGASLENDPDGFTPLSYSAFYNHIRISRYLLDRGAKVDDNPVNGAVYNLNALMFASRNGHKDLVRLLLQRGANPKIRNTRDMDSVQFAKANKQGHVLPLLLCAWELEPGQSYSEKCANL